MWRSALLLGGLLLAFAPAAHAQPVEVSTLAAPDSFTTAGRETGLPPTIWQGASPEIVRTVLPLLAAKPLSPAFGRLARRILATGAPGPAGLGPDPEVTAARAKALIVLGDPQAAAAILQRAPGVERHAPLAEAAAEAALLAGDEDRACAVAEGLSEGRGGAYWLRLRAYCQAKAGDMAEAQLTFDLAQSQAADAVFGRLMGARLSGRPSGAASLRNGLDLTLSRALQLDLSAAKPSAAVAAALAPPEPLPPGPPLWADDAVNEALDLLRDAADPTGGPGANARLAAMKVAAGKMPAGRGIALDRAAAAGAAGETALLALWTAAEAGPAGLALGDRARIIAALARAGLAEDAVALAWEARDALK